MTTLARVSESRGHLRDALQITDEAVHLADESPGRLGHRYPIRATRGHILIELDRPEEARSALGVGMRISEESGVRWPLSIYQVFLALERFITGEWDDAIAELEASFELADGIGSTYNHVFAHGILSLISLHRDDLSRAEEAAGAAARVLAGWVSGYRTTWAAWPRALILKAGGELGQALTTMTGAWDMSARLGLALDYPAVGADLVRLALASGDMGRARDVSAAVTEVAARNEAPWMTRGAALRCRGLIEDDAEILQAAAGACAGGSRPLELALACEDAVGRLRRGRAAWTAPARSSIRRSASTSGSAPPVTWPAPKPHCARRASGAAAAGHAAGRTPAGPASPPPSTRSPRLVAEGLSNPQIGERLYISRRTVQTHLAHMFAKLDIATRAQLAVDVTRHRGSEPADTADSAGG